MGPWGKPFSCSPDRQTSLFFSDATTISISSQRIGCRSSSSIVCPYAENFFFFSKTYPRPVLDS